MSGRDTGGGWAAHPVEVFEPGRQIGNPSYRRRTDSWKARDQRWKPEEGSRGPGNLQMPLFLIFRGFRLEVLGGMQGCRAASGIPCEGWSHCSHLSDCSDLHHDPLKDVSIQKR